MGTWMQDKSLSREMRSFEDVFPQSERDFEGDDTSPDVK